MNTILAVYRIHSYVHRTLFTALLPELQQLIQEKRTYRRRWQRLRNRVDKHHLNFLQRRIHTIIRDFRIRRLEADILDTSRKNNIWPIVRRLRGSTGRANTPIHGTRGLVYDPLSKAEAIADTIDTSFTPHPEDDAAVPWIQQVRRTVRQFPPVRDEVPLAPTGTREVSRLIKRSPRGTAPGLDKLTYEMLKHLPPKALRHLVILFNSALSLLVFPTVWKHEVIITIPKPGKNPIFPKNRRPISLLNVLGKLYERILSNRMLPFIRANSLIPDVQFGFTPTRSTTLQLLRLSETIATGYNSHQSAVALFLDIQKAYDSTWHQGLQYKLRTLQFSMALQHLLASYLADRTFQVRENNTLSSVRPLRAGVPQGAVLYPLLYNLYT